MKRNIDIFGVKVPIKVYKFQEELKDILGYCKKSPLEIHINKNQSKDEMELTLRHEVVHSLIYRIGLDQVISEEIQEILAESFSNFMHEQMRFKK